MVVLVGARSCCGAGVDCSFGAAVDAGTLGMYSGPVWPHAVNKYTISKNDEREARREGLDKDFTITMWIDRVYGSVA